MNAKLQTIAQEQSGATKTNSQLTVANTKNPYQKITVDTCFPTKCAVVTQFHISPIFSEHTLYTSEIKFSLVKRGTWHKARGSAVIQFIDHN